MVIFMPYYRQHGQMLHSHPRSRTTPSSAANTGQHSTTAAVHMSACKFASSILCRFSFSLFLFAISLFLFQLSFHNTLKKKEGSNIIAAILLTIAIVSFLRTCQTLRRYLTIMQTRRRLIQVRRVACAKRMQISIVLLVLEITRTAASVRSRPCRKQ